MTTATVHRPPLTIEQARELADDLLRELAEDIGNREEISRVLTHWLDVLDVRDLSLVCMAAVYRTFTDCLTVVDRDHWPEDGIALRYPPEGDSAT